VRKSVTFKQRELEAALRVRAGARVHRDIDGCGSGLTIDGTCLETFMFRVKAVGVSAAPAIPEGSACTDVFVKEPDLDIVGTHGTSIRIQLTPG